MVTEIGWVGLILFVRCLENRVVDVPPLLIFMHMSSSYDA